MVCMVQWLVDHANFVCVGSAVYVVVQAVRDPLDLHWIIVGRLRP